MGTKISIYVYIQISEPSVHNVLCPIYLKDVVLAAILFACVGEFQYPLFFRRDVSLWRSRSASPGFTKDLRFRNGRNVYPVHYQDSLLPPHALHHQKLT